MNTEIWYERATAIRLTQKNDREELESRFLPQVERTEINDFTGKESTDWIILTKDDGEPVYFLEEYAAIMYAIEYRDRNGKVYL